MHGHYKNNFCKNYIRILVKHLDTKNIRQEKLDKFRQKYMKITKDHRAEIRSISYISRDEPFPYFFEDEDFLIETIKASIREGELKANRALQKMELNKRN
jgi:hypothetical protein